VKINGERFYLWRAVDHEGEVLECFVTKRRNKAVTDEDLQRAIDDAEIEEKLPNEPKATAVAKAGSKRSENASDEENDKNTQASLKALEMLSRGALSEKSALAAMRTREDTYSVGPDLRIKALELVEQGKLSERGLIAILGV